MARILQIPIRSNANARLGAPHQSKGFSVLEMLIAVAIFSLMSVVIATLFINVFTGSNQQFSALSNVDAARLVTGQFANQIRNAVTGLDGSYPILLADDDQIVFFSTSLAPGATVNRIRYYRVGTNLYKGVTFPSGNPLTYNLATETNIIVQRDINATGPIFTYYDGDYNGTSDPLVQPANVNSIKFVKMDLLVLTQVKEHSNATFSISAGAAIRNVKNNLDN